MAAMTQPTLRPTQSQSSRSLWWTYGIGATALAGLAVGFADETSDAPGWSGAWGFLLASLAVLTVCALCLRARWQSTVDAGRLPTPVSQVTSGVLAVVAAAFAMAGVASVASYTHVMAQPPGTDTSFSGILLMVAAVLTTIGGLVLWLALVLLSRQRD